MRLSYILALVLFCLPAFAPAFAKVQPNSLISDGMVLQQSKPVPLWGTAQEGERVSVRFRGQTVETVAHEGKWLVRLESMKAGGPFLLTIAGAADSLTIQNVWVGEVWLCSGQSNMVFKMAALSGAEPYLKAPSNPSLRMFLVTEKTANTPAASLEGQWLESRPDTLPKFSAVAYLFGRELQQARGGIPIGLIVSAVGGTPADAWVSRNTLEDDPAFREILDRAALPAPKPVRGPTSALYNGMIAPLQPYALRGAVWYQGENEGNQGRGTLYQKLLPALIENWRLAWGQGDFPFLIVQLPPFEGAGTQRHKDGWAELREAQLLTSQRIPRVGLVVTTDVGDRTNIHPTRKIPVGERLSLVARKIAYGEQIVASGPTYAGMEVTGGCVALKFQQVDGGLVAKGGPLTGFTIAGADNAFVDAAATIKDNKIVVCNPAVPTPVAARFGWTDYPQLNLYNREGLPASPFRTDGPALP